MMRFVFLFSAVLLFQSAFWSQHTDEVYVARSFGTRTSLCRVSNAVLEKEGLLNLLADENCRPKGLVHLVSYFGGSKKYVLDIKYEDPGNSTYRAMSSYDRWLQIPKTPELYSFVVRIDRVTPLR